ncbi:hypothetical protein [Arcobacter roscoffensis]|uniref:Integrase n=1 Tax=Arcobacter roscoffensis TaxID=2961520 RepID=A0ABY5E6H0_9BACT|nr:hypothetical protein [Arcobacter roscoffensis]UTJ07104.1 hypothetical protein NJU99_03120 [Arcobacter roscoffensis]
MARKSKKLKLNLLEKDTQEKVENKIHFDTQESLLAKEHYGFYLIGTLTRATSNYDPRIYLSYNHKVKYFKEKSKKQASFKKQIRRSLVEVFDGNEDYMSLIKDFINKKLWDKTYKRTKIKHIIIGLSLFIKHLKSINKIYLSFEEINKIDLDLIYSDHKKSGLNTIRSLDMFFGELGIPINQILISKRNMNLPIRKLGKKLDYSISSSLVFQFEKNIKDCFVKTKVIVNEYWDWIEEFNSVSFITDDDLLRTLFDFLEEYPNRRNNIYVQLLSLKLLSDFNMDVDFLFYTKSEIKTKLNAEQIRNLEIKKMELKEKSLKGKNINIKNKKYAFYWLREIFPKYPFDNTISDKYKNLTQSELPLVRSWIRKHFDVALKDLDDKMYPQNNDIYPLYLLLLIKTGVNQEVLKNWKVKRNTNGLYSPVCDELDLFTIIDGTKERSNSKISVVLPNDSLVKKYLDFYIKWATPIYMHSESNKLFQYANNSGGISKKYQEIGNGFLTNIKNSPTSFFKVYEIIGINRERLNEIDHTQIRKSHNYQDFLRGKSEYERQLKKNHKSNDTTKIHYEDQNFEWVQSKKHKIALTQNLIVGIFKGEITREEHKTANLFVVGPMSDCKNNRMPTFENTPVLKENEFCIDWTKCLSGCDKSCVIPKVHGPVIFSWINYMDEQRNDFVREQDWEKEYFIDYQSAQNTITHFTQEEIDFSKKEADKYNNFVKMKFSRTVKLKGYTSEECIN